MKKVLKWVGIVLLLFIAVIIVYALLGKEETRSLSISSVDLSQISDGEYAGEYTGYRWKNTVIVIVKDHKITDIEVIKAPEGREGIRQDLTSRIIEAQSPAVDTVSGATVDSKAFMKAVENALKSAA